MSALPDNQLPPTENGTQPADTNPVPGIIAALGELPPGAIVTEERALPDCLIGIPPASNGLWNAGNCHLLRGYSGPTPGLQAYWLPILKPAWTKRPRRLIK
jgi:hypothetical protein